MLKLKDRVAFISDADHPSGRAIAKKLADEGARLVLNSRSNGASIAGDVASYEKAGAEVLVTSSALVTTEAVVSVLGECVAKFSRVDMLIHNHNVVTKMDIEHCDEETFKRALDENTKTAFLCTQIFGKQMGDIGGGQVVYVSSIHDEKPTGSAFLYSISKGAVKMLCREAALDLGRRDVRVNLIELGPVEGDNERFASEISDLYLDYQTRIPSTHLGTYEDVANLVWFLVIDESRFLNGADIRMDGGFTLHYMDHKMRKLTDAARG